MGLRAYQKIETGETKLDVERAQQLAGIFKVNLLDLVATNDTVNIEKIENNIGGISNNEVTINQHNSMEDVKGTYQLLLQEKDETIKTKNEIIALLKDEIIRLKIKN